MKEEPRVRLLARGCALGAIVLLGLAVGLDAGQDLRAWFVTAGFLALAGWTSAGRRGYAATAIAVVFAALGGLSAVIAVAPGGSGGGAAIPQLRDMALLGVLSQAQAAPPAPGDASFDYALALTVAAGVLAVLAAAWGRVPATRAVGGADSPRLIRAGQVMVAVGFVGIGLAGARFVATQPLGGDLWTAAKSFWSGGSYLLLLAMAAVPGIGVWLSGLLAGDADRREWTRFALAAGAYCAVTLPTGQRGFIIQVTLVIVGVLVLAGRISVRRLVAIGIVGVLALGLTQAARNTAREDGNLSPAGVAERLKPDRLRVLYGSQVASFVWTWDVARYREAVNPIPDTFASVLMKPIPRQIYPDKVQGFGDEFTRRLYPTATAEQVAFAAPLVAEADAAYRWPGALLILAAFGAVAGFVERRLWRSGSPLRAVYGVALGWSIFVLLRGDLANATTVVAAWVVPLVVLAVVERRAAGHDWPRLPRRRAKPARAVV